MNNALYVNKLTQLSVFELIRIKKVIVLTSTTHPRSNQRYIVEILGAVFQVQVAITVIACIGFAAIALGMLSVVWACIVGIRTL